MAKKYFYIVFFILVQLALTLNVFSQIQNDTVINSSQDSIFFWTDSLPVKESVKIDTLTNDSISVDTINIKKSRWNFITGGNDSTYFSFYGHKLANLDSTKVRYWRYNTTVHELDIYQYDSTLIDFQNFHPAYQKSYNNVYLGHTGLAAKSALYFDFLPKDDFIFGNSFNAYNFQSNNAEYFNVAKPFTKFDANIGSKEEQNISVLHTQNPNPFVNGFIRFKNFTGKGDYIFQETRNNTGIIGGSYTQGPLATHLNVTFSNVNAAENGGIVNPFYITDTIVSPNQISTRLSNASNYIKDRQIYFDQKIGFFKTNVPDSARIGDYWFSLQYNFHRHKSLKVYKDNAYEYTNPITNTKTSFYDNTYNNSNTFDSVNYLVKKHLLRLNLEEVPYSYPFVGIYVGFGLENRKNSYFNVDTLFNNSLDEAYKNTFAEGGIYRLKGKKFKFRGDYVLYLSGFKQADFKLNGFVSQRFGSDSNYFEIKGEGGVYSEMPDYFLTNYKSNHFRWNNSFKSVKRSELKFHFLYPKYNLKTGVRFSTLTDYVYLNQEALPQQESKTFTVLNIYLNNRFEFYRFGLRTLVSYQESGNQKVLPLPKVSGYAALYWTPTVNFKSTGGVMRFNIGVDAYYWTSYYAQAYSPALAMFHSQNEQMIGNYPFFGAFMSFEIKRLRFYLRGEHLNYGITKANYFLAPYYPSNPLSVRYGIAWTFYD